MSPRHIVHVKRHLIVDIFTMTAGSLFAVAAAQRSVGIGIAAILCAATALVFDYWNIEDEEQEVEDAGKGRLEDRDRLQKWAEDLGQEALKNLRTKERK